jgi:hypothetical protein
MVEVRLYRLGDDLAAEQAMKSEPQPTNEPDVVAAQPGERDRAEPIAESAQPARKVTSMPVGAKRGGFFKDRDYD